MDSTDDMKYSFKQGYMALRHGDAKEARKRIMDALGISTNMAWLQRLNGRVEPKVSEAKAIEEVFAGYGIFNVWGDSSRSEISDKRLYLTREIQELMHFAYHLFGNDGLDSVVTMSSDLASRIKSGTLDINSVVTD